MSSGTFPGEPLIGEEIRDLYDLVGDLAVRPLVQLNRDLQEFTPATFIARQFC